jgi:hypothetical protein
LIWIDLEMTGLNPDKDRIIEIATVVTDKELTVLAEGPVCAIHQSDDVLAGMDDWNTRQHAMSGLADRVRASTTTEREAEQETLAFLRRHVDPGASPICGNSGARGLLPLPESRRVDAQDSRKALDARYRGPFREEFRAPRARRHPRFDTRAAFLSRAAIQGLIRLRRRMSRNRQKTKLSVFKAGRIG